MEIKRCKPIPVVNYDVVGYMGDGKFAILNHMRLPSDREVPADMNQLFPSCIPCVIEDGQVVYFAGDRPVVLHQADGKWVYRFYGSGDVFESLAPNTFFEIAPHGR